MLHHALDLKLLAAAGIALVALVTDSAAKDAMTPWEDIGLKGLLIGTLIFVVRLLLKQQAEHKSEMRETWKMHKAETEQREAKVVSCLTAQTDKLTKLCDLTEEQTEHYRSFVKAAIDAKMKQE